jgi:hypothetical protein
VVGGYRTPRGAPTDLGLPKRGVRRFIFTAAQNNTRVEASTWRNILALAKHYKARLLVSRFSYNKGAFQSNQKVDSIRPSDYDKLWYDPQTAPYWSDEPLLVAPDLIWCGHLNLIPTADRPLTKYTNYGGTKSLVLPHAKIAMDSIATMPDRDPKLVFTTGCVTELNYIQRGAGQIAEFHHAFGALLVEVQPDGKWWARQLNADNDGSIHDLTLRVSNGRVKGNQRAGGINWGDLHESEMDPLARKGAFTVRTGVLDVLRPVKQFCHDTFSFVSQNHHDEKNFHRRLQKMFDGISSVEKEVADCAQFLRDISRPWCETLVVESNHDNALCKWLNEADPKKDLENAEYFHGLQARKIRSIRERDGLNILEFALKQKGCPAEIEFLDGDKSYVYLGIQHALHGHDGPDGARGNDNNLSRIGERVNKGHSHRARIVFGLYSAGTWSKKKLSYTRGPSSWTATFILTYQNGKRALVTLRGAQAWAIGKSEDYCNVVPFRKARGSAPAIGQSSPARKLAA